jgi:hypothetical protein
VGGSKDELERWRRDKTWQDVYPVRHAHSVSLRLSDTVFVWLQVEDALNVMREAHEYGLALVCECAQDKAEETCESLRLCGLICTIEPR